MTRTLFRTFNGGEVTPELFSRLDDLRFQTGLALAQNVITLPHGPFRSRPGSEHIGVTRDSGAGESILIPFVFSRTETFMIECGANPTPGTGYFRFIHNGVYVKVSDGPTPLVYRSDRGVSSVQVSPTSTLTFGSNHDFNTGDPVVFMLSGGGSVLPTPFVVGVRYYVIKISNTVLKLAATLADALAGTPVPIPITAAGTLPFRLGYDYVPGDLVTYLGFTFYCYVNPSVFGGQQDPSATDYWYVQPASGIYEIPHPYIEDNLPFIRKKQSNDVMTLLHADHPVRTLRRYSITNWQLASLPFASTLASPTNLVGTATEAGMSVTVATGGGSVVTANPLRLHAQSNVPWVNGESIVGFVTFVSGSVPVGNYRAVNINGADFDLVNKDGTTINATGFGNVTNSSLRSVPFYAPTSNKYVVTAVDAEGNESAASAEATVTNNLYSEGAYNTLTWTGVTGAKRYNIYQQENGLFGWIGSTDAGVTTFKADLKDVNLDRTPPIFDTNLSGKNPQAGCYHEQRKVFARDQTVWMTRPGTETDLTFSLPVKDDDRVTFTIAATEFSEIQHLVSMGELIALTTSMEVVISSTDNAVITPTSVMTRPQSFIGSSHIEPVVVNNHLLFAAARGGHLREINYQVASQGYVAGDLSLRATHLFDGESIVSLTVCKAPYQIVWATSSSGRLLGLTFIPEQEVAGWHQHPTGNGDVVEYAAAIPEGDEDRLYLIVRRTVNGAQVRHVERLAPMTAASVAASVFVDDALTFTAVSPGQLSVPHLIGRTVNVLADGIVLPAQTVSAAGKIYVAKAYGTVTVGLPLEVLVQTLPIALQLDGFGQGRQKTIGRVWARTVESAPFWTGPALDQLVPSDAAAASIRRLQEAESLVTGSILVRTPGKWTDDGQIFFRTSDPLGITVLGLTFEVALGD